ncbi:MAG: alanine:cation symporter family protein [Phycisphaeraceae bacterium]|nr:alanine:cation symporter family protein [Phycisphaeraceae bacterium]
MVGLFRHDGADSPRGGIYLDLVGSSLTGYAFDRTVPGMGMWIVTLAAWLFAISTMISWSYYGEQATVFLLGKWAILPYKLLYCVAILIASAPNLIKSDVQLDALTALGTGVMLWANIPIMLIFGPMAMRVPPVHEALQERRVQGPCLPEHHRCGGGQGRSVSVRTSDGRTHTTCT